MITPARLWEKAVALRNAYQACMAPGQPGDGPLWQAKDERSRELDDALDEIVDHKKLIPSFDAVEREAFEAGWWMAKLQHHNDIEIDWRRYLSGEEE